jgi:hypothetical protein
MNPEAIEKLQAWLDGPEPGDPSQTPIRQKLNDTAGTLMQQALVRLLYAISPPNSSKEGLSPPAA